MTRWRSPRSVADVTLLQAIALLPVTLTAIWLDRNVALILVVALFAAAIWEMAFAGLRNLPISLHGLTTALVVTLFCPVEAPFWQVAFAVSVGVVFAELIFGGRGFGFLSPAALALSVLIVAFPQIILRPTPLEFALAMLPGLALLLLYGLVSLPVICGVALGLLVGMTFGGQSIGPLAIASAISVGTLFLICDPTASSSTLLGRWIYGGLAGALMVVFSGAGGLTSEAIVAAALLSSVFVPLIDHIAVRVHMRRWQAGHFG